MRLEGHWYSQRRSVGSSVKIVYTIRIGKTSRGLSRMFDILYWIKYESESRVWLIRGCRTSKFWDAASGLVKSREQPRPVSTQILEQDISKVHEERETTDSPQAPPTPECLSKPKEIRLGCSWAQDCVTYTSTTRKSTCLWVLCQHPIECILRVW